MRAFADEAIHPAVGIYVVGAALIAPEAVDGLRVDIRRIVPRRQVRFHWRDESEAVRQKMIGWIAGAEGLTACAYIVNPFKPRRQERARARCMKILLWELNEKGSTHLVIESRGDHYDKQDRRVILGLQNAHVARENLEYRFMPPRDEPLLWIADAVSSCVATYVRNGSYADAIDTWPLERTIL